MKLASIDFSINSPAITIFNTETKTYEFISFVSVESETKFIKSSKYETYRSLIPYVKVIPYVRAIDHTSRQTIEECKIKDAIKISHLICSYLIPYNPSKIAIEGFSYGSHSQSYIDLIMYQSILRAEIVKHNIPLFVYSPTEGKKTLSGKGNADKILQVNSFISNRVQDPYIEDNSFYQYISQNFNEKKLKPVDDIVDSYGILLCMKK